MLVRKVDRRFYLRSLEIHLTPSLPCTLLCTVFGRSCVYIRGQAYEQGRPIGNQLLYGSSSDQRYRSALYRAPLVFFLLFTCVLPNSWFDFPKYSFRSNSKSLKSENGVLLRILFYDYRLHPIREPRAFRRNFKSAIDSTFSVKQFVIFYISISR